MRNFSWFTACMLGLICFGPMVQSAPSSDEKIKELARDYQDVKDLILGADKYEREILSSLYSLNQKMRKMSERRDQLNDQVMLYESQAKKLARKIAKLEEKISAQRRALAKRLRALYILGGQGVLRMLFSSSSSHELDRTLYFLKIIADRDYELIRSYQKNVLEWENKKLELRGEVHELLQAQTRLKSQEQSIEQKQGSKAKLLAVLKKRRTDYLKKMRKLRLESRTLGSDEEESFLSGSIYEVKGRLIKPVDAAPARSYGLIEDEEYRYQLSHKGHFYAVPEGSDVRAVFDGVISFVGQIPGYGLTVIVDHGDHYYSVYSHTSKNNLDKGARVEAGQVIAVSGRSAKQTGLYFEIRHFSDAVDPDNWLAVDQTRNQAKL